MHAEESVPFHEPPAPPTAMEVILEVAARTGVQPSEILMSDRHKQVALARHVAMYVTYKEVPGMSFPRLAAAFQRKDHTTALSATRKVERLIVTDPRVAALISTVRARFRRGMEPAVQLTHAAAPSA